MPLRLWIDRWHHAHKYVKILMQHGYHPDEDPSLQWMKHITGDDGKIRDVEFKYR